MELVTQRNKAKAVIFYSITTKVQVAKVKGKGYTIHTHTSSFAFLLKLFENKSGWKGREIWRKDCLVRDALVYLASCVHYVKLHTNILQPVNSNRETRFIQWNIAPSTVSMFCVDSRLTD